MILSILGLLFESVSGILELLDAPLVKSINFVQSDTEGSFLIPEHLHGFECLFL